MANLAEIVSHPWPVLTTAARIVLFGAGALLLFLAVFFYEDEQRRLQSRIESWWIRLDDFRSGTLALELNMVSRLSLAVSHFLDTFLGRRLISMRAVVVSNALSALGLAALCIFAFVAAHGLFTPVQRRQGLLVIAFLTAWGATCLIATRYFFPLAVLIWTASLGWLAYVLYMAQGNATYERILGVGVPFTSAICAFLLSIVLDLLMMAAVRFLLRKAVLANPWYAMLVDVGAIVICLLSFFVPAVGAMRAGIKSFAGATSLWLFLLNSWNAVFLSLLFVAAALLVLHHALWPVVERPLYALQRTTLFDNRKATGSAGIGLMMAGLAVGTGAFSVFELMKRLIGG